MSPNRTNRHERSRVNSIVDFVIWNIRAKSAWKTIWSVMVSALRILEQIDNLNIHSEFCRLQAATVRSPTNANVVHNTLLVWKRWNSIKSINTSICSRATCAKSDSMIGIVCTITWNTFMRNRKGQKHIKCAQSVVGALVRLERAVWINLCVNNHGINHVPFSGKKFASNYALIYHENSDCGRSPKYKCDDCGKFYHSAGSLKSHRLIHTGEMAYACNTCGKAFRNKGQLKIHSRCHSGERPYACDYCEKSFAHRESLLTHTSLHTGRKRFLCQGCNLRFSCISNLQAHRRSHKTSCGLLPIITKPINWTTDSVQQKEATDANINKISDIEFF